LAIGGLSSSQGSRVPAAVGCAAAVDVAAGVGGAGAVDGADAAADLDGVGVEVGVRDWLHPDAPAMTAALVSATLVTAINMIRVVTTRPP
jgi:hypothetical protein